ncbi:MAG TPA: gamma-glutamylcyclotransferase [Alphaproteobacteria bacterium]|nr:gamma-glutamylcyclotransferase [Alphaproteobacteria bacterium]
MTDTSFHFDDSDRAKIDGALQHYLDIDNENRKVLIDEIERTGRMQVFGYGSLIADPHTPPDEQTPGVLVGHRRDAVFTDRHLRGTPRLLGLTMGIYATGNSTREIRQARI